MVSGAIHFHGHTGIHCHLLFIGSCNECLLMTDVAVASFSVSRQAFGSVNNSDWDRFAALCDGGYRSSFRFLRATHILRWPKTKIHLYEIHALQNGKSIKILSLIHI
jgi:hypothetical protein